MSFRCLACEAEAFRSQLSHSLSVIEHSNFHYGEFSTDYIKRGGEFIANPSMQDRQRQDHVLNEI